MKSDAPIPLLLTRRLLAAVLAYAALGAGTLLGQEQLWGLADDGKVYRINTSTGLGTDQNFQPPTMWTCLASDRASIPQRLFLSIGPHIETRFAGDGAPAGPTVDQPVLPGYLALASTVGNRRVYTCACESQAGMEQCSVWEVYPYNAGLTPFHVFDLPIPNISAIRGMVVHPTGNAFFFLVHQSNGLVTTLFMVSKDDQGRWSSVTSIGTTYQGTQDSTGAVTISNALPMAGLEFVDGFLYTTSSGRLYRFTNPLVATDWGQLRLGIAAIPGTATSIDQMGNRHFVDLATTGPLPTFPIPARPRPTPTVIYGHPWYPPWMPKPWPYVAIPIIAAVLAWIFLRRRPE